MHVYMCVYGKCSFSHSFPLWVLIKYWVWLLVLYHRPSVYLFHTHTHAYTYMYINSSVYVRGFPGSTSDKNPPPMPEDPRGPGSIPGSGRSPGVGNGNSLQYSCLENFMEEEPGGLQSMGPQRVGQDWAQIQHMFTSNSQVLPLPPFSSLVTVSLFSVCESAALL